MSEHDMTSTSSTIVTGSEEDFYVICDPCNSDDQRVQATGHCIDCNENMCISCLKFHRKLAAVKDHVIKNNLTLSQSQKARAHVNRSAEDKDPMTDRCLKHPDELIKFYCNSHSNLGCSDCISLDHRSCKDVLYIKDVSGSVADSDELAKIQTDIQKFVARFTSIQSRAKWIKQTMNDSYSKTISDIRNLKRKLIDMLDQSMNDMLEKAWSVIEEKVEALDSAVSACESTIRETKELLADIEKKKGRRHNNQLFISMKNAKSRILDLADEVDQLCDKSKYWRLSFQTDERLDNLLSTQGSVGEIILVSQTEDVRAEYLYDINIISDTDTGCSVVSSITALPDGRLAVTDYANMSVKLVDVAKRKVAQIIKLESKPLDLATITSNTVAVTLEGKRYIQVLSVSPVLSKSQTITVPGLYYGIKHVLDQLILVCREPTSAVHICDMTGVVLQQIETDYGGNKLFTQASRLAVSPDHGVMYVSDVYEHVVVCLTMDGKLISKHVSESLKFPIGIAVNDYGYAYVCSMDADIVSQLSPSGKLVTVLVGKKDGLIWPVAIAYRAGHLYICNATKKTEYNNIKVYEFEK